MVHKIMIAKKDVKLYPMLPTEENNMGKIKIVAAFPEISSLTYRRELMDTRADVIQKKTKKIEKIIMKALDEIEEVMVND